MSDHQRNAIIIDDDPFMRDVLRAELEQLDFRVSQAVNGNDGLALLETRSARSPELVVVDILMPEKEGLETIMQMRKSRPDMKIIAVSSGGYMRPNELLGYARKLGAHATLSKPIDFEEFERTVKDICPNC